MMTFLGVPILDWVLLAVLLGFGVEAYRNRWRDEDEQKTDRVDASATRTPEKSSPAKRDDTDA